MHPSLIPNWILRITKWPIALLSLSALPFAVESIWQSPIRQLTFQDAQPFLMGAAGYWILWLLFFRTRVFGSYLSTFEHELTHALFAWLTLHKVTGLSVTWRSGGLCSFEGSGGGNWLIYIAPYWFPTVVVPCLLFAELSGQLHVEGVQTAIGVAVGYQVTSTWRETHPGQSDLQKTGHIFALCFLPTANILTYGSIALWTLCSLPDGKRYLTIVWQTTLHWLQTTF